MKRILFSVLAAWIVLFPSAALATCTCYDDENEVQSVEETSACQEACGEDTAVVAGEGTCDCVAGGYSLSIVFECESICQEAGFTAQPAESSLETPYEAPLKPYATPQLSVPIPGVTFSPVLENNAGISVNFIGEYISGAYEYLLGIAVTITIVFIMIGGLQYVMAGSSGETAKAKQRITNAVTGLVLLLFVYVILYTVNPQLTRFPAVTLKKVQEITLDRHTDGDEGVAHTGAARTLAELAEPCKGILEDAQEQGTCSMTGGFSSPTGYAPNCGNHHWFDGGANGDWRNIKNLDYAAPWDQPIYAPFAGIVSYEQQTDTSNRCGNRIYLEGSGARITICHAKDFTDENGEYMNGRQVEKGDVLGHLGGNCCAGEQPPSNWSSAKNGWCDVAGTACSNPTTRENCSCQPVEQSGNTSGPHVHVSWSYGGNFLSCLSDE